MSYQCQHMKKSHEKTKKGGLPSETGAREKAERDERVTDDVSSKAEIHAEIMTEKEHECAEFFAELIECLPELFR